MLVLELLAAPRLMRPHLLGCRLPVTQVEQARRVNWRGILIGLVVLSLLSAPWSWIVDGFTPSMVVYPIFLLIGLWRLRKGGVIGTVFLGVTALVFLLVHLPWTWAAITDSGTNPINPNAPYNPGEWLITLFLLPLLTGLAALMARREALARSQ